MASFINMISIHALRKESDEYGLKLGDFDEFQSTLSVRRATGICRSSPWLPLISIHALRKESDRSG